MTTLRRELRQELVQKFVRIINEQALVVRDEGDKPDWHNEQAEEIAELFADCALDLLLPKKPAFNMEQAGVEWQILAGAEISQDQIDTAKLEKEVTDAFESAFGITRPWNWYPDLPKEKQMWGDFRAYLVELYMADKDCFTKYFTWAAQPYSRGAMTSLGIKRRPYDFPDSWAAFCASAMYTKPRKSVPDEERTDLDSHGAPISY